MKILIEKAVIEQALEAIETSRGQWIHSVNATVCLDTITALREALAEQAEQKPVLWGNDKFASHERPQKPKECANGCPQLQVCDYCQIAEQAEQEPVAWRDDFERCRVQHVESFCHSHKVFQMMQKYAAPVRTKDLTDDEIYKLADDVDWAVGAYLGFARAVIAADREKNK